MNIFLDKMNLPRAVRHPRRILPAVLLLVFLSPAFTGEAKAARVAADTTRRDTTWMERVRRHEATVVRQESRQREEIKTQWIAPGVWRLPETKKWDGGTWSARVNALRWATLTPAIGVEWRLTRRWAIVADAAWTAWSWDNSGRQYRLWEVASAVHYNLSERWFAGLIARGGEFNYKLGDTGRQGWQAGGGILGGYTMPLCPRLAIEFRAGVGYIRANYRKYRRVEGVDVRGERESENYVGMVDAGINLNFRF